jgi:hypothetical protein
MTEAEILERIKRLSDEWVQLEEKKHETHDIPNWHMLPNGPRLRPIYARHKAIQLEVKELADKLLAPQEEE